MSFIKNTFAENESKYISAQDLILYVKALDGDSASLSETAKFILLKYDPEDILIGRLDDAVFEKEISGAFSQYVLTSKDPLPFYSFLKFVAEYDAFDEGVSDRNQNWVQYNPYSEIYVEKTEARIFLCSNCGLKDLPDFDILLQKQKADREAEEQANKPLSGDEAKQRLKGLSDILNLHSENDKLKQENNVLAEKIGALQKELSALKVLKKDIPPTTQIIEPVSILPFDNRDADYELIQKHRKRAPEFEALIQTLKHHESEYESDRQPMKVVVAATFSEQSGLSHRNRRCAEAARILGLPE